MNWLEYENFALSKGYKIICGVDEAGRGPLAGPVYAAAVILPEGHVIEGVNDSKKISEKKPSCRGPFCNFYIKLRYSAAISSTLVSRRR